MCLRSGGARLLGDHYHRWILHKRDATPCRVVCHLTSTLQKSSLWGDYVSMCMWCEQSSKECLRPFHRNSDPRKFVSESQVLFLGDTFCSNFYNSIYFYLVLSRHRKKTCKHFEKKVLLLIWKLFNKPFSIGLKFVFAVLLINHKKLLFIIQSGMWLRRIFAIYCHQALTGNYK